MDPRIFSGMLVEKDDLSELVAREDLDDDLIKGRMESIERLADDINMRGTGDICGIGEGREVEMRGRRTVLPMDSMYLALSKIPVRGF